MTRFVRLRSFVVDHPIGAIMIVGLCLAALGGAAELVAREALADRIRKDPGLVGADATVRQHGGWALAAMAGERLPEVDIVTDNARLGPFTDVSLQVEVYGLRLGSTADFERVHGMAVVDADSIAEAFKKEAPGLGVTAVVMNTYEGTISIHTAGIGAPKRVVLKPEPDTSGVFALKPVGDGTATGGIASQGTAGLSGTEDQSDALGLKVLAAAVERDGLHLVMDGGAGKLHS